MVIVVFFYIKYLKQFYSCSKIEREEASKFRHKWGWSNEPKR